MGPERVNPAPASVTEFTLRAADPDEVSVSVLVEVVCRVTSPKVNASVLKVSLGVDSTVPIPPRVTVLVTPLDELLEMVTVPRMAPITVGSKIT